MKALDLSTAITVISFITIINAILIQFIYSNNHTLSRFRNLVIGYWIIVLLTPLTGAREALPALLTIVLANTALFLGILLIWAGLRALHNQEVNFKLIWLVTLIYGACFAYFTHIQNNVSLRIIIHSAIGLVIYSLATWQVRSSQRDGSYKSGYTLLQTTFLILITICVVRLAIEFFEPSTAFLKTTPEKALLVILYISALFTMGLGIMLLLVNRIWNDLDRKQVAINMLNEKLDRLAHIDSLTNLHNRRHFVKELALQADKAQSKKIDLSLCLLDIDHFKQVNDSFGHDIGDDILIQLSRYLGSHVAIGQTLARIGGEEFSFLLPNTNLDSAKFKAEEICQGVYSHFKHMPVPITCSIGVATMASRDNNFTKDLFKRADRALYLAKNNGRNCVAIF